MPLISRGNECPIDRSPWRDFANYYFAETASGDASFSGMSVRSRVAKDWQQFDSKYRSVHLLGDAISDPLGRAIIDRRVSRSDFEQALTRGIETVSHPDPVLQSFFDSVDRVPDYIDMDSVARGSVVLKQIPITVLLTHGIVAGFVFAAINPNSAIPLSLNKSILQATQRRYIETTKYVADTISSGGMDRFGPGFQSACRVRLVHAFVRSEIDRHYDWNTEAYGAPINPVSLLAAAAVPDVWAIRFSQKHGCHFSKDELRDITSHNAYLSYLQGVPEEFLITDYDAYCEYLCWAICQSDVPLPEDHQRALSVLGPLLKNGYPLSTNRALNWFFNQTVYTATRSIMGDEICDAFDIPRSRGSKPLSAALTAMNNMLVGARRVPALNPIYKKGTSRYWDVSVPHMVEKITGKSQVTYAKTAKTSA